MEITDIIIIGLNHNTAPIEIRERLAFSSESARDGLNELKHLAGIDEVLLISTCNRVEVVTISENHDETINNVKTFFCKHAQIELKTLDKSLYIRQGDEAIKHLFRVASSLDSMVVGEPQILGQIKDSYRMAVNAKTSGVVLNRLLHRTFFVAKRVRSETGIGDHAVSISYAAVELARKIFGTFDDKKIMLIGAGEMAELAVEHLIKLSASHIYVANRTFEKAMTLAQQYKGTAIRFDEIQAYLVESDIIISSTGSPNIILTKDHVKNAMRSRKNKPLFLIDIAVPRDIDPEINRISNAYVYDIDDLKNVIDDNLTERKREALQAERILDEALITFKQWLQNLQVVPTIKAIRNKIEGIAQLELNKTFTHLKDLKESDRQAISRMMQAFINKCLHDPILYFKDKSNHPNRNAYIDMAQQLFGLNQANS